MALVPLAAVVVAVVVAAVAAVAVVVVVAAAAAAAAADVEPNLAIEHSDHPSSFVLFPKTGSEFSENNVRHH